MEELWNKWELPVMVLSSLLLQFVLVLFGNRRKYQGKWSSYVAILVWSTYLLADWVATVVLSTLLRSERKELNSELVVFWTPFLLLHLGGPDTISAYSLQDNELWLRHLLGLIIQVGVAAFVYTRFRTNSTLTYMAIPIFIAGIIKYGERIWILRAATRRQFRNSIFSTVDQAPASSARQASALTVDHSTTKVPPLLDKYLESKNVIKEGRYIYRAFCMFKTFTPLFSDLNLKIPPDMTDIFILFEKSAEDAFRLVEVELGFLYDVLYTKKTSWQQSIVGIILNSICLLSTFMALIAFSIEVGKSGYPKVDIAITYMLLGGAIFFNMYSAISKALSSWTILWLTIPRSRMSKFVSKFVVQDIISWLVHRKDKKRTLYMAQHSLIGYCLQSKKNRLTSIVRFIDTEDILGKLVLTSWKEVNHDVRNFIHLHLLEKQHKYRSSGFRYEVLLDLLSKKGDGVLRENELLEEFDWSINGVEFNHCLLIWHIATNLLFYHDQGRHSEFGSHCQISKLLSDYMMYLLLVRPNMLPEGIGELRIQETRKEVNGLFINESLSRSEVVNVMSGLDFELAMVIPQSPNKSKSVIAEGCQLLRGLHEFGQWDHNDKWKLIADVWMEMLAFTAGKCKWREHATQLRQGGELLTHVALLMAHLGLTKRIKIVTDYSHRLVHFDSALLGWNWEELSQLPYYLA
ncbi:hypothetical protein SLEP1_g21395 [Rubroshorea leprosula]|uniref:DUF4220 domain-containing protein n=1 Tax=Rubroshorea leprosula TaxID=152421 RepID=A0AAV5J5T6_9ROSI|nr:hypothetical protein SLEP1_g21395 [Rubroshorea leprosula]